MSKYVTLTANGERLYDATYQTMLDRLMPNGYASTSLAGGAYAGMFVRDSSIQVMQHIAQGDMNEAKRILQYMTAYHKILKRDYALHVMNPLVDHEQYDYMTGWMKAPAANRGSRAIAAQTAANMGLYLIMLPEHQAAQKVKLFFDTIKEVKICLDVHATAGTLKLSIGKSAGDDSIASAALDIAKVGSGQKWCVFDFDVPVSVEAGETYFFTVGAADTNGAVVAVGMLGGGGAYNYDVPALGGWQEESHSLAYEIRSDLSIVGEENAITQQFTTQGDRIETITVALTIAADTTLRAVLSDANGNAVKRLTVPAKTGKIVLDMDGLTVDEGKVYGLKLWTDGGAATWDLGTTAGDAFRGQDDQPMGDSFALSVFPEYSGTRLGASVIVGGETVATTDLPDELTSKYVTSASLYLSALGEIGAEDTVTVSLYKGDVVVDVQALPLSALTDKAMSYYFRFCLPVADVAAQAAYSIRVSASRENSVQWYGLAGEGNSVQMLSYRVGCSNVRFLSDKNQVDGHYMWVNSFAMFALEAAKKCPGVYDDFIKTAYPFMVDFAMYYFTHEVAPVEAPFCDGRYLNAETGLLYNPSYEHSRNGRYWRSYDLITNVFASEAMHKLSLVAQMYDTAENAAKFQTLADDLAAAIHKNLTCEFHGKTIYAEMINTEVLPEFGIEPGMIKGFSFPSLAPTAAEWYALDKKMMQDTYEAYLEVGTEKYAGVDMLAVVVELDKNDNAVFWGNHVIGKGFAWELYDCWINGDEKRVAELMDFMERSSKHLTYIPETWGRGGGTSDSANQEHANWILYTLARVTGKYQK